MVTGAAARRREWDYRVFTVQMPYQRPSCFSMRPGPSPRRRRAVVSTTHTEPQPARDLKAEEADSRGRSPPPGPSSRDPGSAGIALDSPRNPCPEVGGSAGIGRGLRTSAQGRTHFSTWHSGEKRVNYSLKGSVPGRRSCGGKGSTERVKRRAEREAILATLESSGPLVVDAITTSKDAI